MDVLDKLKNDWNKNGDRYPKISENEIYAMLHRRSSSIVKWILLISIIEFAFFLTLTFMLNDTPSAKSIVEFIGTSLNTVFGAIDMGINLVFMYLFYVNYKKITNTDTIKNLMSNILKTRKIVSRYIFIKLAYTVVMSLVVLLILYYNDPEWLATFHNYEEHGKSVQATLVYFIGGIIGVSLIVTVLWLFYKLIYGILLKRLNKNYQELKKIEI
ncbi:hypothetical protein [Flavobacterium beibuense]|uniref:hypothetical protein n=1 Tax=Flavobacterium beibuense TaxID=657326 RepID=UPI003A91D2B1